MTKIFSSELHRNDNASTQFDVAIIMAVERVRQSIASLSKSRKADEYAPGAIHALRKLCDGEGRNLSIHQLEVEEWRDCFFAWFERVKKAFPKQHAARFQENAHDDFRAILECATNLSESFWRQKAAERSIQISFKTEADLTAARKAADEKYPVRLGGALHQYIERCVAELVGEKSEQEPAAPAPVTQATEEKLPDSLSVRFVVHEKEVALCVDNFRCFDTPDDLEQDIVTTAYDVEDAVQKYLKKQEKKVTAKLHFDCESSMFCVLSSDLAALSYVVEVLISFAADRKLYAKFRSRR